MRYGRMFSDVVGEQHWYRGNWEVLGELFGGGQYYPSKAYVVGLTPILRYNLATGRRWVPFIEGGAGATATDIGHPDLSTTFEFNVQGGVGMHYFWRENAAITVQYRFLHLSNAGIKSPNAGVNTSGVFVGLTCFF